MRVTSTSYPPEAKRQVYNGLDCAITWEIFDKLQRLRNQPPDIYQFELALQAPYLDIMRRGFKINETQRQLALAKLRSERLQIDGYLQQFAQAVWNKELNPNSPKQLIEFFYRTMQLPEVWLSHKGVKKLSTGREALEKLEIYFHARPVIACILAARDIGKKISTLETEVDPDGRLRTSYNIAGTETGRLSSSASAFGTGGNLQNITLKLRRVFESDTGWKLLVIDMEQSESREVGFIMGKLFGDWSYLDMCEAGDLHTQNTRLVWPELGWTGDLRADRKIAEGTLFYREHDYRYMAKRGVHLTSYLGSAWMMARSLKIPQKLAEDFQGRFFTALPAFPKWHQWCAATLQTTHALTTQFGRHRDFFGRPNDPSTLREFVAFEPQSMTADRTNLAIWRIWKHYPEVQLLANGHDAVILQYPDSPDFDQQTCIAKCLELCRVELSHNGRVFAVPGEAKVGWNWGAHHNESKPIGPRNIYNPNGLRKWTGADPRVRLGGLEEPL